MLQTESFVSTVLSISGDFNPSVRFHFVSIVYPLRFRFNRQWNPIRYHSFRFRSVCQFYDVQFCTLNTIYKPVLLFWQCYAGLLYTVIFQDIILFQVWNGCSNYSYSVVFPLTIFLNAPICKKGFQSETASSKSITGLVTCCPQFAAVPLLFVLHLPTPGKQNTIAPSQVYN